MLTIEPPIYQHRGVTVFRDHADPDQFYYLPPLPRLARSGDEAPPLTLYKYRRDLTDNPALDPTRARGAGLALFEVEAALDSPARLQAEVASLSGRSDARLAPVLFRSGEVRAILAHAEGDRLVEDLAESRTAPVAAPHHAAFALALTAEGATLFEQAALGGLLPVGVAYELRFLALTPALSARVTMDYERMYDHFSASVGFTYYVSAKLDLDLTWLIENDLVKIDIVTFTDRADEERQRELVMDLVKTRIQRDFFRSGIPPKPEEGVSGPLGEMLAGLVGGSEITSASAVFVLKAKLEVVREQKHFELTYDGRTAVELTHVATGLLATLLAGGPPPLVREIDLDDPFFSALNVEVVSAIDFEEMADLTEAAVHLTHGEHRKSFPLSRRPAAGPLRFQVPLTDRRADEYGYEVEYHFDPDLGGGAALVTAGPFRSRHRVLVVDPLAHLRYRRLRLLLGPVDPARVPRLRVRLRVPGEDGADDLARATVELDHERREQVWRHRFPMAFSTLRLLARTDWQDPRGDWHEGEDEEEVTGDTFVALGPYRDLLAISVQPAADWARVNQVAVEVLYEDGEQREARQVSFTKETAASQRLEIPLLDPARRRYRWRQTILRADGTAAETEWEETDRSVLIVGSEAPAAGEVRVVWVGAAGDAFGLRVDFWVVTASGEEETTGVFLRTGEGQTTATLPLAEDGRLRYRYEVRRLGPQGEEVVRLGEGESNLLVVQAAG